VRRHLVVFLATVAVWIGLIIWGSRPFADITKPATIDFKSFEPDARLIFRRVPNHERDALKLSVLKVTPPPCVGIFGDHTARFATASSFGLQPFNGFFNFSFGTLTLPEVRDILRYAANSASLPKVVIVQIESPRIHSGTLLVKHRTPLPWQVLSQAEHGWWDPSVISNAFNYAILYIRNRIDWAQVLSSLSLSRSGGDHIILRPDQCRRPELHFATSNPSFWQRALPETLRSRIVRDALTTAQAACSEGDLSGIGGDGSLVDLPKRDPANLHSWPTTGLQPEDAQRIASTLTDIHRAVSSAGSELVLLAAPVFSPEHDVPLNAVLTRALAMLDSKISVYDRRLGKEANSLDFFYDDDEHPNAKFYAAIGEELARLNPTYRACLASYPDRNGRPGLQVAN